MDVSSRTSAAGNSGTSAEKRPGLASDFAPRTLSNRDHALPSSEQLRSRQRSDRHGKQITRDECALPRANSLAARGRVLSAPAVPVAALPGAKLLAARERVVPVAQCAWLGAKSLASPGCFSADVPDVPAADVSAADVRVADVALADVPR